MQNRWWAAPIVAGAAALLAACGSSSPSASSTTTPAGNSATAGTTPQSSSSGATVHTTSTSVGTVMVNSKGDTIYWFAIDTPTKSNCTGTCLNYWLPVTGKVSAAAGSSLTGTFGTITRSNGQVQATYDGHPLYTYVGDTAPGQVNGNDKNLSGGLWWAMTPSAAKPASAPASSPSSSSSSSGGGYGY